MGALMRQVWITGPGSVEVRTVPVPAPGPGEALVRTAFAGICGSDLHTLTRGHPWLPYPVAPGHEASGQVVALGDGAHRFAPGDDVYLRPVLACGTCAPCRRARPNLCTDLIGVGSHLPGLMADFAVVPEAALARVPAGVGLAQAALIEPLATAVHALARAGDTRGAAVQVTGGGAIGQCVLLALMAAGVGPVAVVEPVAAKRALASALGAARAIDPASREARERVRTALGGRPDVVFDCVGSAMTIRSGVAEVARGGSVVVVGVGHGEVAVPIETVQDHEVTVTGSAMYTPDDLDRAAELVAEGVPVARLITSVRPLADAAEAMAAAATGTETKIHLAGRT
ncbi:zinc-binding dehydrogenase [Streptomyces sp. NPDC059477]|uniref:zinc-dependent alcohol dehydrogenase n=1 Tax=Streptomyces sp. NPDC059477 TaxID=3346847 RepID=UPI0036762F14